MTSQATAVAVNPTDKMPLGWDHDPSSKCQSQLLLDRRQERIPHSSYDLDNDGKVGGQDLVISKIYDKDKDGRLNSVERAQAESALSQGVADRFVWGVEQSGPTRAYRLIQKRGVIVDQEDFSGLRATYPKSASITPEVATFSQLREQRDRQRLETLHTQKTQWDLLHPSTVEREQKEYPKASNFPYHSQSQKLALEAKTVRLRAGLTAEPARLTPAEAPSLDFVQSPTYNSQSQLRAERKAELLSSLSEKKNFDHKTGDQRLIERESKYITIVPEGLKGRTYSAVKEKMQQAINEANMKTFSSVVIGIHGQELPKFSEHNPEYWRDKPGFVSHPLTSSRIELRQQHKFWAPPDPYKLTDKDECMPPPDPFKSVHVKAHRKEEKLPEKPNRCIPVPYTARDPSEAASKPRKYKVRWTTLVHYFNQGSVFAPMKDPEIEDVDEVSVEEKKEVVKVNVTHGSSEPVANQTTTSVLTRNPRSGALSRKLTKAASTSLVRSSGFVETADAK